MFSHKYCVWLDDERQPPSEEWLVFKTAPELISWLICNLKHCLLISLDHDLGYCNMCTNNHPADCKHNGTGYDVICAIEEMVSLNSANINLDLEILCHSANPSGRAKINSAIKSIKRLMT